MSGLRPKPSIRVGRLEQQAEQRELASGSGLSAPALAWQKALRQAPAEEVQELRRLCDLSQTFEPGTRALLVVLLDVWMLRENIMYREAPTLAAFFRTRRDLLHRALDLQLNEAAHEERRYYDALITARANRSHALASGAEPVSDFEEAERAVEFVLEAVAAGETARAVDFCWEFRIDVGKDDDD